MPERAETPLATFAASQPFAAMSEAVKAMFGRIAPRYDLLNRVLSGGQDVAWRRRAVDLLEPGKRQVLDLACGTYDLGLTAVESGRAEQIHGCDFCVPMLSAGEAKRRGQPITAAAGDALHLPYADASFDGAMVAYGLRNFGDPRASLLELRRVLRPGGQLLVLEFFRPVSWWPRTFYGTFGRWVFPTVGGMLAGDSTAYRYLKDSIEGFISPAEMRALVIDIGFAKQQWLPFFGGISHAMCATVAG